MNKTRVPAAQEAALDTMADAIPVYEVTGQPDVGALRAFIVGPHRSRVTCV